MKGQARAPIWLLLLFATLLAQADDLPPDGVNMAAEIQAQYERDKAEDEAKKHGSLQAQDRFPLAPTATSPAQSTTYTPEQLRAMVARGPLPDQGRPTTTTQTMDYAACVVAADSVASAMGDAYPTKVIVNTALLYVVKLWANDAAVVVTCSVLDRSMVTTISQYR